MTIPEINIELEFQMKFTYEFTRHVALRAQELVNSFHAVRKSPCCWRACSAYVHTPSAGH